MASTNTFQTEKAVAINPRSSTIVPTLNKADRTGMTTLTRTCAVVRISSKVISIIVALASVISFNAQAAERDVAVSWAIEHRKDAFDRLMPAVNRFGSNHAEVAFSIRAEGFEDHF